MPNMTYIFQMESPVTGYFFESSEDNLILHSNFVPCPRFCIIKNFDDKFMYVNYYQNISETVVIKVTGFGGEGNYFSYRTNNIMISSFNLLLFFINSIISILPLFFIFSFLTSFLKAAVHQHINVMVIKHIIITFGVVSTLASINALEIVLTVLPII